MREIFDERLDQIVSTTEAQARNWTYILGQLETLNLQVQGRIEQIDERQNKLRLDLELLKAEVER